MPLTIGQLARAFGLSPDALRYYERLGLLAPEGRTKGGYRLYGDQALDRLRFIKEAQAAGLRLEDIAGILRAMEGGQPPCRHVREALERRLEEARRRLRELQALERALAERLAYAEAHPDPACDGKDHCVYLDPLDPRACSRV
ncbi:MerR family transcriptional regulator [Thermus sp.]|jgi:DNA-binding transcriptional MerR regulator|uniref:MerR family transcriptional regulator n=1 Tax=Thermus sp. TaxID=275 RepID=UPI003220423E